MSIRTNTKLTNRTITIEGGQTLSIHGYRHNVQFSNARQGFYRPLMWLFGESFRSFSARLRCRPGSWSATLVMAEIEIPLEITVIRPCDRRGVWFGVGLELSM